MAFTGNLAWYISSVQHAAITAWATGVAKSVGDLVRATAPAVGSERVFVCTVAGTTGGAEPTWTTTRGAVNTDNTVTWQEATGIAALNGDLDNTPSWNTVKNTAVSLGHVIKSNDGQTTLICSTAGTAGNGSEPSWSSTLGATTADNTVTWRTLKISGNKFGNWAGPFARMAASLATNWGDGNGQTYFLSSDHDETQSTAQSLTGRGTVASPNQWLSVDRTGSVPPVAADLEFGARIAATNDSNYDLNGWLSRVYGIQFEPADSGNVSIRPTATGDKIFDTCLFYLNSTGSGATIAFNNISHMGRLRFENTQFRFGNAGQGIQPGAYISEFINCSLHPSSTVPNQLFRSGSEMAVVHCRGCDWSPITGTLAGVGSGQNNGHQWYFEGCKINASVTPFAFAGSTAQNTVWGFLDRCDSGPTTYKVHWQQFTGTLQTDIVVVRHGGAVNPANQAFSWSMTTTANANFGGGVFDSLKMTNYNSADVSSADMTVTVYGIANTAAMPTDLEAWINIDYMGDASSPKFSTASTKGDTLGAGVSLPADTSDWDDNVTARANTTAYVIGDIIKTASNPGRIFFCTTAGTTAGVEPGGYSSAIDGGSISDGTAVFRAGWRFAITKTLFPQLVGNLQTQLFFGKASATIYIDPAPVVS